MLLNVSIILKKFVKLWVEDDAWLIIFNTKIELTTILGKILEKTILLSVK